MPRVKSPPVLTEARIRELLAAGHVTAGTIAHATGKQGRHVYSALYHMEKRGLVERVPLEPEERRAYALAGTYPRNWPHVRWAWCADQSTTAPDDDDAWQPVAWVHPYRAKARAA